MRSSLCGNTVHFDSGMKLIAIRDTQMFLWIDNLPIRCDDSSIEFPVLILANRDQVRMEYSFGVALVEHRAMRFVLHLSHFRTAADEEWIPLIEAVPERLMKNVCDVAVLRGLVYQQALTIEQARLLLGACHRTSQEEKQRLLNAA